MPKKEQVRSRAALRHEQSGAPQAEPQTSIVWVRCLVGALVQRGFERDQLFQKAQLLPSQLRDSRVRIPLSSWGALVQRALSLTQDDALGLAIGRSAPESVLRITGQLALASATLRDAVRAFERYHSILGDTWRCGLVEEGDRAYIVHAPAPASEPALARFDAELMLSFTRRVALHFLRADGSEIKEIWFEHRAPSYPRRYEDSFGCAIGFDRPRNAIVVERSCLDRRQRYADPWYHEVLRDCAERMLAEQRALTLPDQVRAALRHGVDLRRAGIAHVARLFGMDARRLQYKLMRANARWSRLVDEARHEVALVELRRGDTSLRELAERLGFSDQSAFNRAFRRWTGMTPSQYGRSVRDRRE